MRNIIIALSAFGLLAGSVPALAAPCRDAKGQFVKCAKHRAKPARCRDTKGHYAKCRTKGAKAA
jgi:hypothetical protein